MKFKVTYKLGNFTLHRYVIYANEEVIRKHWAKVYPERQILTIAEVL